MVILVCENSKVGTVNAWAVPVVGVPTVRAVANPSMFTGSAVHPIFLFSQILKL